MYTRRWASLLLWLSVAIVPVSQVAVAFSGKAFLSSESGASALDARTNPMIVGPRPVRAGFAEVGCLLLAQTSRVHILTGSGAKVGCCLPKYGATSVESGLSGGWSTGLDECTPAGRAVAERRIRRVYGYGR